MESAVPGLSIGLMISDEGQLVPLQDRDALVARESKRGEFPTLRSIDDNFRVRAMGWGKPAGMSPGGRTQFEFHVSVPLSAGPLVPCACQRFRTALGG
ncbi:DUF5953 family protein [Archangium violaceum]|uniref:DUF5953 family protein n=1 Tax=Archangium violaceum TaxID=83451 RepID=UPI002B294F0B|nr:DUF5953 family protein [Archangium gephyra]